MGPTDVSTLWRYTSLSTRERAASSRALRLVWASGGDREHAAAVARMIADGERIARRRLGWRPSGRAQDAALAAAYAGEGVA